MLLQFYRVEEVPDPVAPGVCYVTRNGINNTAILHFVSQDGTYVYSVGHLDGSFSANGSMHTVDNIVERDALILTTNSIVMVLDASDDPYVSMGSAMYYYDHTTQTFILSSTASGGTGHTHTVSLLDIDKAATLAANNQSPLGALPDW